MAEPLEQSPEVELATLRRVNAELLKTKHEQKARITALEGEVISANEKADKATIAAHAVVVDQPLKKMVGELSNKVPELVLREMLEDFAFDAADDGSIRITSKADGKEIRAKDGKPVAWTKHALQLFLIGDGYAEKSPRQLMFTHLLGVPTGSGGIGRKAHFQPLSGNIKKELEPSFGLR